MNIIKKLYENKLTPFLIFLFILTFMLIFIYFLNLENEPLLSTQVATFVSEKDSVCRGDNAATRLAKNKAILKRDTYSIIEECKNTGAVSGQLKALKALKALPQPAQ